MVRNGGPWGLYTPPAPSERIIPTRNGTVTPPQGPWVVRGTLLLATYVMYAVVDAGVFRTPKPLGVPSRSLGEGHRGRVLHKGTPPLSSQPLLLSLCCP